MWIVLLVKSFAVLIIVSGAASAMFLIGYTIWSSLRQKNPLTAQEKAVRQEKHEEAQIRRRWHDTIAAVVWTILFLLNLWSHHLPWGWGVVALSSCVMAVHDWQLAFIHRHAASAESSDKHH